MNVLHIVHGSPAIESSAGGTERYVHALALETGATVVAPDRKSRVTCRISSAPYPLWSVGIKSDTPPLFHDTWSSPLFEAGLKDVIEKTNPEIVHIHHLAHVGLTLTDLLRKRGTPYIITLHDHHLLCVRGQLLNREMERCPGPSRERCPSCVSEHLAASPSLHKAASLATALGVRRFARRFFEKKAPSKALKDRWEMREAAARRTLLGASTLLSPSAHLARRFRDHGLSVTVQDLPLLSPIERQEPPDCEATRFLFVGSLIPSKGPHILLEAMKSLPDCNLELWGPVLPYDSQPGWAAEITQQIKGTANAHHKGSFTDKERSDVYGAAHVLVVPSIWEENSPLIVREGVAAGLHIIGTLGGGVSEIDPSATMVPANDTAALVAAMLEVRSRAKARRPQGRGWPLLIHTKELDAHYLRALE